MWVRAGDWDKDFLDSDSESDSSNDDSEPEHEDDVRRSSDWNSDSDTSDQNSDETNDSKNRGGQSQVEAMFRQITAATISLLDTPEPLHTIDAQTEATCMHPIWECECGETSQFLCDCFVQEPQYCNCYGPIPAPAAGVAFEYEIRDMREAFQSQPRFVDTLHEWVYSRGVDQVTVLDMNDDENDIDDGVVPDLPDAKDAFDADEAAVREAEQRWGRASPSGVTPPVSTGTPAMPPMATPFKEPYYFPKNSALDALRGNDTARTGGQMSVGKLLPRQSLLQSIRRLPQWLRSAKCASCRML
jgi:hypothetical protein